MADSLTHRIVTPDALSDADRAVWDACRSANGRLDHPYFDWRYTQACAGVPGASVAVFERAGETVGFFPFQRRGRLIQPLGSPLTDYHGVIAAPGEAIGPVEAAQALGGSLRVGGWMSADVAATGFVRRERMAADVSGGGEALGDWLQQRNPKFAKNLRRQQRAFERDFGAPVFAFDDQEPGLLDWVLDQKRDQYRRTRRHDVFACGWTAELLRRLRETRLETGGYGLRISTLRTADGRLAAAEAGLDDGRTLHLWFPVYDAAFAKYGPGVLLTWLEMLEAADAGYGMVDFGCGEEAYKSTLAEGVGPVFEGVAQDARPDPMRAAGRILAAGPAPLRRLGTSLGRRFDVINACETRAADWWAGAALAAVSAARKQMGASA